VADTKLDVPPERPGILGLMVNPNALPPPPHNVIEASLPNVLDRQDVMAFEVLATI